MKLTDLGPLPMPWEALAAWPLILLRAWVTAGGLARAVAGALLAALGRRAA